MEQFTVLEVSPLVLVKIDQQTLGTVQMVGMTHQVTLAVLVVVV